MVDGDKSLINKLLWIKMDLTFTESDLTQKHNALLLKYQRAQQANHSQHDIIILLQAKLKEQEGQILELKEKVTRLEADQIYKIEDLLKKQREKLLESMELEKEWRVKAHDNELAKRDIKIKQLEHRLDQINTKVIIK